MLPCPCLTEEMLGAGGSKSSSRRRTSTTRLPRLSTAETSTQRSRCVLFPYTATMARPDAVTLGSRLSRTSLQLSAWRRMMRGAGIKAAQVAGQAAEAHSHPLSPRPVQNRGCAREGSRGAADAKHRRAVQ
eukprot:3310108-Rhodomonas_salina.2